MQDQNMTEQISGIENAFSHCFDNLNSNFTSPSLYVTVKGRLKDNTRLRIKGAGTLQTVTSASIKNAGRAELAKHSPI